MKRSFKTVLFSSALAIITLSTFPISAFAWTRSIAMVPITISANSLALFHTFAFKVMTQNRTHETYVPVWYVDEVLKAAGYTASWKGKNRIWNLNFTNGVNIKKMIGTGPVKVFIDRTLVARTSDFIAHDPKSGRQTVFLPLNIVQAVLQSEFIRVTWKKNHLNIPKWPGISRVNLRATNLLVGLGQSDDLSLSVIGNYGGISTNTQVAFSPQDVHFRIASVEPNSRNQASVNPETGQFTARVAGDYYVQATIDGVTSLPVNIDVCGSPTTINLSGPTGVPSHLFRLFDDPNSVQSVLVAVSDAHGLAVPGQTITLLSDDPNIVRINSQTAITNGDGVAMFSLMSGSLPGTTFITASVDHSITTSSTVEVIPQPAHMSFTIADPTVVANSDDETRASVTVTNANGSPVVGIGVHFTSGNSNLFIDSSAVYTDLDGKTSIQINPDFSGQSGIVPIMATVGTVTATANLDLVPGIDATKTVAYLPPSLTVGEPYFVYPNVQMEFQYNKNSLYPYAYTLKLSNGSVNKTLIGGVPEFPTSSQENSIVFAIPNNATLFYSGSVQAQLFINGVAIGSPQTISVST